MALANRAMGTRQGSRPTSRPTTPPTNGLTFTMNGHTEEHGRPKSSKGWVEPLPRHPVPSFSDHPGFTRGHGLFSEMQALGIPPNAKQKRSAKLDPLRRAIEARQRGSLATNELRATPDISLTPSAQTRAASMVTDDLSRGVTPMDITQPDSSLSPSVFSQANIPALSSIFQPAQARLGTPLSLASTMQNTPIKPGSPFDLALSQSISRNDHALGSAIKQIHAASEHDPELAALLKANACKTVTPLQRSALKKKLKELKKSLRSQSISPLAAQTTLALAPSTMETLHSPFQSEIPPASNNTLFEHIRQPSHKPSPTALKLNFRNPKSNSSTKRVKLGEVGSPLKQTIEPEMSSVPLKRRDSNSSLSDVDENILSKEPASLRPYPSRNLKRASAEVTPMIDADEEEQERRIKRARLEESFVPELTLNESNVRPQKSRSLSLQSASNPAKRLRLSHTNGDRAMSEEISDPDAIPVPTALGRPPKRQKPQSAARVKHSPVKGRKSAAVIAGVARLDGRESRNEPIGPNMDDNSEQSDNHDFCSACGGGGFLLCCDGCDRSFHFTCLDPPLDQEAPIDEPWFCYICQKRKAPPPKSGLFSSLLRQIDQQNPNSFSLPSTIRGFFDNVRTGADGEYMEVPTLKDSARPRTGHDEHPDWKRLEDKKGNFNICNACGKSSDLRRDIIPCDYCSLQWHLDCLDPPRANPPNRGPDPKNPVPWMCPDHIEHDLRHLDPIEDVGVRFDGIGRTHRIRRPKMAKIVSTHLRRGLANNGLIEVEDDDISEAGFESEEENFEGIIYRLPASGIKLDFIHKVKSNRLDAQIRTIEDAARLKLSAARLEAENQVLLSEALRRRSIKERQTALNLAQFATNNNDLSFGPDQVTNLVNQLEAEANPDIIAELATVEKLRQDPAIVASREVKGVSTRRKRAEESSSLQVPKLAVTKEERERLLKLQELIRRRLEEA